MIAYLRGKVVALTEETVILDVNGVGYEAYCSGGAFRKIGNNDYAELYTYLQVKEDGMTLFGFADMKEKELFLKVISVSGVGPKLGIAILTGLSAEEFLLAVQTADAKRLSTVKGLGKKTAEKIILELHGKISAAEVMSVNEEEKKIPETQSVKLSKADEDAVSALMGLGFTRNESAQAVKKAREAGAVSVEDVIMKALQSGI
jgi:Holliday junction DNA helicase RuvA